MHTRLSLFFSMLAPQFAVMAPSISSSMARFRMLFANNHNYAGRSDSLGSIIALPAKGLSRQFFEPLDSVQECSEPLF
jgi:hypothetical protein